MDNKKKACIAIILYCTSQEKKKRKRRWTKKWIAQRQKYTHLNLLNFIGDTDPEDYRNYFRMSSKVYNELLHALKPYITKQDTNMRQAISSNERLAVTLRFLATGRSFEDLKFSTIISPTTISEIVMETCSAIVEVLADYIKMPSTKEEWKKIGREFGSKWQFWNCIGAIDGKHVLIVKPPNSGSRYYNYKGTHSIVLLAIVDANYEFIMVDVGTNGRVSDGGVLYYTDFWEMFQNNRLNIPEASKLPNTEEVFPHVFLGDEAFSLAENFMKPYSQDDLSSVNRIFNYRLSRARRVVENAFGILVTRFGIFQKAINLSPEKATVIVLASCYLHNFLMKKGSKNYYNHILDVENKETGGVEIGTERCEHTMDGLRQGSYRNASRNAKQVREHYRNYFNKEGQVDWQKKVLN